MVTPTSNAGLPLRLGGFADLREALDYAALGETGLNFHSVRGELLDSISYKQLRAQALGVARGLLALGLVPGERIGIIAETSPRFLALFYGAQYAGVVPCTLPYQAFPGGRDAYVVQLCRLINASQARHVFSPRATLAAAMAAAQAPTAALDFDALPTRADIDEAGFPAVTADVPAYVQFSSGSTATPKGVVVSQQALMANATAIAVHGLHMHAADRAFSWLPLYHDMGLVGFSVVAMCGQRSVDYLAPQSFAARPLVWLELMSRLGSTIVYAPSFAWRLAAQRYRDEPGLDLSALRIAGIGGDQVRAQDLREFVDTFAPAGFHASAFQPSYGLAEATLAVSMGDPEHAPRVDRVVLVQRDDNAWIARAACDDDAQARELVSCGRPLPGNRVQVADAAGRVVAERTLGQIWIGGAGVMQAYQQGSPPQRDAQGLLATGDIGYLADGELFLSGRQKDLVIIRGRNLWPQDVEQHVATACDLEIGRLAALGIEREAEEVLVVLIQLGNDGIARDVLRERIIEAVVGGFGVRAEVAFVPPRGLPYTTSGKLARGRAKALYLSGAWCQAPSETEDVT